MVNLTISESIKMVQFTEPVASKLLMSYFTTDAAWQYDNFLSGER